MKTTNNGPVKIPAFVSSWTDDYFHKSAFDMPVDYPSKKIVSFLSRFKKRHPVKLFRGLNKYNEDNFSIMSWTYDRRVAERYAKESKGRVVEKLFFPAQILLDTTILKNEQKWQLGYDYKIDDKEVLISRV